MSDMSDILDILDILDIQPVKYLRCLRHFRHIQTLSDTFRQISCFRKIAKLLMYNNLNGFAIDGTTAKRTRVQQGINMAVLE